MYRFLLLFILNLSGCTTISDGLFSGKSEDCDKTISDYFEDRKDDEVLYHGAYLETGYIVIHTLSNGDNITLMMVPTNYSKDPFQGHKDHMEDLVEKDECLMLDFIYTPYIFKTSH